VRQTSSCFLNIHLIPGVLKSLKLSSLLQTPKSIIVLEDTLVATATPPVARQSGVKTKEGHDGSDG